MEGTAMGLSNSGWLDFAGVLVSVRVDAAASDGRLGMWESIELRGAALPMHVHDREDEQVVLLEGDVAWWVGDRVHHVSAGETLALPRGVPHAHVVTSSSARILTRRDTGRFRTSIYR